jgi:hypothetical protein
MICILPGKGANMKTSFIIITLLVCYSGSLRASESETNNNGLWGEFDFGWASTKLDNSISGFQSSEKAFINLGGGYHWGKHIYAGIEFGGLGLEDSNANDPTVGAGISPYLVVMRFYVASESPYFIQVGAGRSHYWTNKPNELGGWGNAYKVGAGWDISVHDYHIVYITPAMNFYSGDFNESTIIPAASKNTTYQTVSFSLGLTLR